MLVFMLNPLLLLNGPWRAAYLACAAPLCLQACHVARPIKNGRLPCPSLMWYWSDGLPAGGCGCLILDCHVDKDVYKWDPPSLRLSGKWEILWRNLSSNTGEWRVLRAFRKKPEDAILWVIALVWLGRTRRQWKLQKWLCILSGNVSLQIN